jgi:hypothetical protein
MECRATIERQDEEEVWVHWSLTLPGGGPVAAEGRVRYELETVHFHWQDGRPPAEHEFLVRTTIDRLIRGRSRSDA